MIETNNIITTGDETPPPRPYPTESEPGNYNPRPQDNPSLGVMGSEVSKIKNIFESKNKKNILKGQGDVAPSSAPPPTQHYRGLPGNGSSQETPRGEIDEDPQGGPERGDQIPPQYEGQGDGGQVLRAEVITKENENHKNDKLINPYTQGGGMDIPEDNTEDMHTAQDNGSPQREEEGSEGAPVEVQRPMGLLRNWYTRYNRTQ